MLLEPRELERFFRLHRTLMFFVNRRLGTIPDDLASPQDFAALSPEVRVKVRDALVGRLDLIEAFVEENPAALSGDELDTVVLWRHMVADKFFVFRELKKYTVFLTAGEPTVAYGVLALSQPFEELIGPHLPLMVETILLPFEGRIVYDGLMTGFNVLLGPGIRRSLKEGFEEAKARQGVVTSLPASNVPPPKAAKAAPAPKPQAKEKKDDALRAVVGLVESFCEEHLNEEYATLCRELAEKLCGSPSPLLQGTAKTWAAGIVRAIGGVNFLGDPSQTPHMTVAEIDHGFGVSQASGSAKAKAIRDLFRMRALDPDWTLPSRLEDNPLVWMLKVNGIVMDVRRAPRDAQVVAFEQGLIPYVPADRR